MRVEEVVVEGLIVIEKRLSTRELTERESAARLRSEATLLARLSRAGGRATPRLVAAGEDAAGPWFRLERVAHATLARRLELAAGTPIGAAWIERAARATFTALAELHESSDADGPLAVVHADLSPSNIAIDDDGNVAVLLDLELASWREAPPRDGAFRGTARYVAPEVARGESPSADSDLFALAASLLHAATGTLPRDGASLASVLVAAAEEPILARAPRDLAARGHGHAAIVACLAHERGARPRSARDVLAAMGLC